MADASPDDWLFNSAPVPAADPSVAAAPAPVTQSLLPRAAPTAAGSGLAVNNPLNLRPLPAGSWGGQTGVSPSGFATFGDVGAGWNAADQNLQAKVTKHGLTTIAGIIGDPQAGWAPASDNNDPAAYAGKVSTALGVKPGDDISQRILTDPNFRHQMLSAMAGVETGQPVQFGGGAASGEPEGLTPAQEAEWKALQVPAPTTPTGQQPSGGKFFTVGGQQQPVTQAQEATLKAIAASRGWNPNGVTGFDGPPYPLMRGGTMPQTPGAHYVDLDGKEHIVPGGLPEMLLGAGRGALQGVGMDTAASINRLTSGGAGFGGGDPMLGAYAQSQGGPSAFESAQGANAAFAQQQRNYAIENGGNMFAQAGRLAGQSVPAITAAALAPDLEAPAALGGAGRLAATATTNALRGVAATAPSVGANPQGVGQQLATGAVAGAVLPPALRTAGMLGSSLVSPSASKVAPEVLSLADEAINKMGIPLRASQIAGTADPALAVKDSNLITAPGSGFGANHRAQLQAITRAVGQTFGADTDKLTPQVMTQARRDLGQGYDNFAASHSVSDVSQLHAGMDTALSEARQVLPASELAPLENQVANIKDLTAQNGGTLPGATFQALTRTGSPLDRAMESKDSNIRFYAGKIHDALTDAIMGDATPEDQSAFSNLNLQYKNLMTVKGLAAKADIQGAIPAKQIPAIVNRNFDRAFNDGGPLGKIADVVSTFMPNVPNSFTAQRAAEIAGRNWLPGLLGGGALGEAAMFHDPGLALKLGASAALAKGGQLGVNALEGARFGAGAGRGLVRTPGAFGNAVSGARKGVEVPLSALAGVRAAAPIVSGATNALGGIAGNVVGANAQ